MLENLIDSLRLILGEPEFYKQMGSSMSNYTWDYGAMLEYMAAVIILCVCIASVFKFLRRIF